MSLEQQGVANFTVEIGFGISSYDYVGIFTDVTEYVRSVSITRGKTDDFQDFSAGQASVVLSNNNRFFDPSYAGGPFSGSLKPRTPIIITLEDGVGSFSSLKTIFRGFIGGWPQDYSNGGKDATVTLPCYDLLALVSQIEMPTDATKAVILSYSNAYTRYFRFGDFVEELDHRIRNPCG